MTRLLFVHGIAQEGKSADLIKQEWLGALNRTLEKMGKEPITSEVCVPFYGSHLADLTKKAADRFVPSARRNDGLRPDEIRRSSPKSFPVDPSFPTFAMEFAADAIANQPEVAAQALATSLEARVATLKGDSDLTKRGIQNWPPIVHAIQALEGALPSLGQVFIELFLKTTHCYLTNKEAFDDINGIVESAFAANNEPTVVVGHSLGSVVSYHVLHQSPGIEVPIYITLGSPLAVGAVKSRLRVKPSIPGSVLKWYNAFDPQDIVALNPLNSEYFLGEIDNNSHVTNRTDNHHGIAGYLEDQVITSRIAAYQSAKGPVR